MGRQGSPYACSRRPYPSSPLRTDAPAINTAPPMDPSPRAHAGSLYDVLRKARRDAAFAARLTWPRRLLMALDAGARWDWCRRGRG